MKHFYKFLLTGSLLMHTFLASAQITTSAIDGTLRDELHESIIGATIQAIHLASGTTYGATTDLNGCFHIQGMRAGGPYKVIISYIGYETRTFSDIQLKLGETLNIPTVLKESAELMDEVVVVGKGGIDATKTGAAMSMSLNDIQRMPSISHGMGDVLRTNPQVSISNNGSMSFVGANNRYNSFQIDGAMNNDNFGLTDNGSNGGIAGTQPMSMETIEQIQVNVAPFDVRLSGFTGGSINAITKSGTNSFHGTLYGFGNNQELIGKHYQMKNGNNSDSYTKQNEFMGGFTLGGPIIKNKLFFFANYEKVNKTIPFAYGIGSPSSKADAEKAREVINYISSLAKEQGIDYKGSFLSSDIYTRSDKAGVKLDWNINDIHKATLHWSMVHAKQLNNTGNACTLHSSDFAYDYTSNTHTVVGELQSHFSNTVSNEARLSYVGVRDQREPGGHPFPMIQVKNVGDATMNIGNERSSMINSLSQDIWTFTDNLTLYSGNHSITLGTHNELYRFSNLFIQDYYGSYYFNSPDDLYASRINRFRYNSTLITGNPLWKPTFSAALLALYAQDKYHVNDNLTLTYGLRLDTPVFLDTPEKNEGFNQYAAGKGWDVMTNHKLSSAPLISPRFGFRWRMNESVLRGGVGVFTGRIPFVWLSNNFSYTGVTMSNFDAKNQNINQNLAVILDPNKQEENASLLASSGAQAINVFDKKFKFAQTLRFNLGFDTTIGGIDWTAEAVWSQTLNDVVYRNLAYDVTGSTLGSTYTNLSFDQRPMMERITKNTPYNAVYLLDNTHKGYNYSVSLKGSKHFDFGLDVAASYTYSHSEAVNSGVSSMASGNWNDNPVHGDSNRPELGISAYNKPHSVSVSAFYSKSYGAWNTQVGLIYTGCSGSPYSLYYDGDLNGDGSNTNDLIFIPTDSQIDQMSFKGTSSYTEQQQKDNLKSWIASDSYLSKHRGEYYDRYADNEAFEHHFDLHLSQKYNFHVGKSLHAIEMTFDVMNIGNMFNKKWGHYSLAGGTATRYCPIAYAGNGEFQFLHKADYDMRSYDDYFSRWRGQIGVKYTF